jgi:hypothetical protein
MKAVRSLLVFVLLLIFGSLNAQNTDRYWAFGDSAAIDFKNLSNPVSSFSTLRARGSCVSICDSVGNLLFYSSTPQPPPYPYNTVTGKAGYVTNKNHLTMQNGDTIVGSALYQEMVIVPDPSSSTKYYLFCAGESAPVYGLFYSQVDLSYNNGLGKVIQKNVQLNSDSIADGVTAVRHGNGRDWWVIVRNWKAQQFTNDIMVYLVNANGITTMPQQNIGIPRKETFSRMKFNNTGNHLYCVAASSIIERYDFDRCTGLFSNPITFQGLLGPPYKFYWGFEVSPDESKLYVSSLYQGSNQDTAYLIQFDLNATNFLASVDTIGTFLSPDIPGLLEMGPNKKIYASVDWSGPDACYDYLYCYGTSNTTNNNLSVINYPDSAGTSCDFQPFSFKLGGHKAYVGLPNNPNYEQTAWVGSPCDTLTSLLPSIFPKQRQLSLYYDPSWQTIFVNAAELKGKRGLLEFYNSNGQLLSKSSQLIDGGYFMQSSSFASQPSGVYIVRLQTEKEVLVGKFVKR